MSDKLQNDLNEVDHQSGTAVGAIAAESGSSDQSSEHIDTNEYLYVSAEQHELHASGSADAVLTGDGSDDHLYGAQQNDVLDGSDGNDMLDGGAGNDVLIGGGQTDQGTNSLAGGYGDDILVAGGAVTHELHDFLQAHQDVATAIRTDSKYASLHSLIDASSAMSDVISTSGTPATGSNTFVFHDGNGNDSVFNFHAGSDHIQIDRGINGSDIIDLNSLVEHTSVYGSDVTIDLGQGNSITLVGVDVANLTADSVLWA